MLQFNDELEKNRKIIQHNLQINKDRGLHPYYYMEWRSDEFEFIDDILSGVKQPTFNLNNFPDPGRYFNLEKFNVTTTEEFTIFWRKLCGQDIIKFESFTYPQVM